MSPSVTVLTTTRRLYHQWSEYFEIPGLCVTQGLNIDIYQPCGSFRFTVITCTILLCRAGSQYLHLQWLCVTQVYLTCNFKVSLSSRVTVRRSTRPLSHPERSAYIYQFPVSTSAIVLTSTIPLCHPRSQYLLLPGLCVSPGHSTDLTSTDLERCISNSVSTSATVLISTKHLCHPWESGWVYWLLINGLIFNWLLIFDLNFIDYWFFRCRI